MGTLQGTNISPQKWHFEDDFPFPKVGYVNLPGCMFDFLKKLETWGVFWFGEPFAFSARLTATIQTLSCKGASSFFDPGRLGVVHNLDLCKVITPGTLFLYRDY